MKRKVYNKLLDWKLNQQGRSTLMIEGARRIGKSYIAEEFGRNEYDSYLLIDFNKAPKMVREWFDLYLEDLDTLFLYLSQHYKTKLYPRRSLIILDEVQLCPRARAAVKFLVQDGRFDYIETGSLVSIKKNVQGIVIPSEECKVEMYPMDFEEFLWAVDEDIFCDILRKRFEQKQPLGQDLHRKAMELFRLYMIVGGMPQAVLEWVQTKDFDQVDRTKRNILNIYRNDIFNYAGSQADKVATIFDEIPGQLSKHEKKFRLSALTEEARYRDWSSAFFWLKDAKVANICYNTSEPNLGLKMNEVRTTMKCYFSDTGLLISHAFDENGIVSSEVYRKLLLDKLEVNEGMFIENVVGQMLTANGHKLFFFTSNGRQSNQRIEIDFLLQKSKITSRHNIIPIEVKSGTSYTLSSLKKYTDKYQNYTATPIVLHPKDIIVKDGILFLPLYMTMFL